MTLTTFTSLSRWRCLKPWQHRKWGNLFICTGVSIGEWGFGNTKQEHALPLLDSLVCLYVDNIRKVMSVFKTLGACVRLCSTNKKTWVLLLSLWSTAHTYHARTLMGNLTMPFREMAGTLKINDSESTFFTSDTSTMLSPKPWPQLTDPKLTYAYTQLIFLITISS